ncbi:MAG: oxygenase MpaB family protein [Acidimicrobiales bacterium]
MSVERAIEPVRLEIQHLVRSFVTGSPAPPRRLSDPDDPSLFEPDSAIWRVHADVSMFIGGLRALLLQTLHEPTMTGVAAHSDYREDPLGRLRRTANFLGMTTYGPRSSALETIDAVKRIHDRVQGTLADGTPYSANDPHLLGWVHATEVDSFLRAYQRYATRRLDAAQSDQYVADMAVVATLMGVDDPPTDRASLRTTLHSYRRELRVTPHTRDAVRFLLHPPFPLLARPTYNVIAGAAVSLLPGYARRMLWLPVPPGVEPLMVRPVATALMRTLGWALAPAPTA